MKISFLKSIILFTILISCFIGTAQNQASYQFKLEKEFKTSEREIPQQYIGSNENGHYFIYSKGKYGHGESTLVKFSTDFQPTNENIHLTNQIASIGDDIYQDYLKEESLGVIKLNDKLYNITSISTKEYRKFFAKTVNLNSFTISNKKEIATIKIEGYNVEQSYMSFLLSRDSTSLGLFYTIPTKKKEDKKFSLKIFDKQFNEINHFNYQFPYQSNQFALVSGFLLNSEEMIIMKADYSNIPVNAFSKKILDYKYALYSLHKEDYKLIGKIPNDNKWFHNFRVHLSDSTIKVVGLYANTGKFNSHGVFYHEINRKDNSLRAHILTPFPQEVLNKQIEIPAQGFGAKKILKKHQELPYYVLQNSIKYDDGSILQVSEQIHTFTQYVTTYYHQNILLNMIDKNGNVLWSKILKKDNSKTGTPTYSGYMAVKNNNRCYLIYNGNPKNLIDKNVNRYKTFGGSENESIILISIDTNGQIKKDIVATKITTGGFRIRPGLSAWINNNQILLFSQKPRNVKYQRFMNVTFDSSENKVADK